MKDETLNTVDTIGDLKKFVTYRLARLQSRLNAQAIRLLRAHSELSLTEWRVLAMTALVDEATLSVLSRDTELDKGQLSRAVSALVKKRLLKSEVNDTDHRQNMLSLTQAGTALHDKILPVMRARQKGLTAEMTAQELELFHTIIDKLERAALQDR